MESIRAKGFTLIELVMVTLIVSVIAAYATVNWPFGNATVHAQAEQLARDIRHTQMIAMGQHLQLSFTTSSTAYQVTDAGGVISDPSGSGPMSYSLEDGVTLSSSTITFDSMGQPDTGATITVNGSSTTATVSVLPVTGFVSVSP